MRPDMVFSYVRDLLGSLTGSRPEPDQDGDLPVTFGGARFYVRVVGEDPVVQVFAVAVTRIPTTHELLAAVNDVNLELRFARAMHVADQVLIESELWGSDLNPANFAYACRTIAAATDRFGPELQKLGGEPSFEMSKSPEYELDRPPNAVGPYL